MVFLFGTLCFLTFLPLAEATTDLPDKVSPDLRGLLDTQLEELDLGKLDSYINQLDQEISGHLPIISASRLVKSLTNGELPWSAWELVKSLLIYLGREIAVNLSLLAKLLILTVACAVLQNLSQAFGEGNAGKLAHAVAYLALLGLAFSSFSVAVGYSQRAIDSMVSFVHSFLPVLLPLVAASGAITSAAVIHPALLTFISALSALIKNVVFPLIYCSLVVNLVSEFMEKSPVSRLGGFLRQVSFGLLGLGLTIFVGMLGIQGVGAAIKDGLALRSAKFVSMAFIPVVGKMFSDAMDAVLGTTLALKNALGLAGAIIIVGLAAIPVLKILSLSLIYKAAAILAQPLGDMRLGSALDGMGGSLTLVFAAVAAVALMLFIALGIIVGLTNLGSVMAAG